MSEASQEKTDVCFLSDTEDNTPSNEIVTQQPEYKPMFTNQDIV